MSARSASTTLFALAVCASTMPTRTTAAPTDCSGPKPCPSHSQATRKAKSTSDEATTPAAVAARLGVTTEDVVLALDAASHPLSLDAAGPAEDDDGRPLGE